MAQGALSSLYLLQVGKETSWGVEVAATARLLGDGRLVDLAEFVRPERDYGVLSRALEDPVEAALMSGIDFSTDLSYEQILHILSAGVKGGVSPGAEQTPGQGDFLWVFGSPVSSDPAVDPFTLEGVAQDGSANIEQFTATGGIVTEFNLAAANGANLAELGATWRAKGIVAKAPAADPGLPTRTLVPTDKWTAKVADTQAGLGAAGTLSVVSFDLSITTGIGLKRRLAGSTEPADKLFGPYEGSLSLVVDLVAATEAERVKFRSGSKRFIRLDVQGAQIGTGLNYEIQIDLACHLVEPPTAGDEDGQETRGFSYSLFHDTTWAKGYQFGVTNKLSSLP